MTAVPGIGAEFAGYRIVELIGRGGVGLVYLAEDLNLPRRVALKILRAEYAVDPQFRERFESESRRAASLDHLNIVPIYRAGEADGVLYIAMRYVEGTDLRRLLAEEGPLGIDRAVRILAQVGSALDAAHAKGLIHRDVKPANILVTAGTGAAAADQAYLVDFGITKNISTAGLTRAGLFLGTVDYAAPEQIRGSAVDARTDVYSLGCVLFECLGGAAPFRRDTDIDTLQAHLVAPRPQLSALRPEMGPAMDHVVRTAMAVNPDDRYGSAMALITAVRAARPWTGMERRTSTHPPVAAPAPASGSAPAPPRTRTRLLPLAGAGAALVAAAVAAILVLSHRGGGAPAVASAPPTPTAAPPPRSPGTLSLDAALLTLQDFAAGSVAPASSTLQLSQVSCGVQPAHEVDERRVAFTGRGDTASRAYFNAAAAFDTEAHASGYMDGLRAAAQRCPVRTAAQPAAPQIGDESARVVFSSAPGTEAFVFDALYVRRGRVVGLVLVSDAGTTPPPPGDAVAFAGIALRHMIAAGA